MGRRIYVASSWRCPYQPLVVGLLRNQGHKVYDFRHPSATSDGFHWSEIDPAWESWSPLAYVSALGHPIARDGFSSDFEAMRWADTGVLVLPSGRSAHLEAGYFVGAGKELHVLMLDKQEPELMYLMAAHVSLSTDELVDQLSYDTAAEPSRG